MKLLSNSKIWHSDGTFFAAPKPFKLVYIIHAYTCNGHMLPCAYFLTEMKDCNLYKKILTSLKTAAEQMNLVLNPKTIVTIYGTPLAQMVRERTNLSNPSTN